MRYAIPMRTLFLLVVLVMPTAIFAAAHSGVVKVRTAPELSDIALFVMACAGVWLVRRAMRARFAQRTDPQRKD